MAKGREEDSESSQPSVENCLNSTGIITDQLFICFEEGHFSLTCIIAWLVIPVGENKVEWSIVHLLCSVGEL